MVITGLLGGTVAEALTRRARCVGVVVALAPMAAVAQSVPSAPLALPSSYTSDMTRLRQLAGDTLDTDAFLLRSPSLQLSQDSKAGLRWQWLRPAVQLITNSAIPYSMNDGALWAGRGVNFREGAGVRVGDGRWTLIVAPEFDLSSNARFDFDRDINRYFAPAVPETRYGNGFADVWYVRPYSADLPWRFGSSPFGRLNLGQSGVWFAVSSYQVGATAENTWWGPGMYNALLMSDNAAGVPRLEVRTAKPIRTSVGDFRWVAFIGALSESAYFDTTKANDVRSLSAAAVTWRPSFSRGLTLGAARVVYASTSGYGGVLGHTLDVFSSTRHTGHVNSGGAAASPAADSALQPGGADQLLSLFGRFVVPSDGVELYAEWGRQQFPKSLRDFLLDPSHSQGYTFGVQWRRPAPIGVASSRSRLGDGTSCSLSSVAGSSQRTVSRRTSNGRARNFQHRSTISLSIPPTPTLTHSVSNTGDPVRSTSQRFVSRPRSVRPSRAVILRMCRWECSTRAAG